jgi:hypothetical protein
MKITFFFHPLPSLPTPHRGWSDLMRIGPEGFDITNVRADNRMLAHGWQYLWAEEVVRVRRSLRCWLISVTRYECIVIYAPLISSPLATHGHNS